jgi:hypothetical protein
LFELKAAKQQHKRIQHKIKKKLNNVSDNDDTIMEPYIGMAKDKQTVIVKGDTTNSHSVAIDTAHTTPTQHKPSLFQQSKNLGKLLSALTLGLGRKITNSNQCHIMITALTIVAEYKKGDAAQYWSPTNWGQTGITSVKGIRRHWASQFLEYPPRR